MLSALYIQNYALIEALDIRLERGFSVITGETGAGKSILLGAINLLLGGRADSKAIRNGATKCVVEARFEVKGYDLQPFFETIGLEYDDECIVRRELYATGKSRAFINDTPVQLAQMKELGERLIDIHSQHQNLLLNSEDFQLEVLDILAYNTARLNAYKQTYRQWQQACRQLEELVRQAEQSKADEDYLTYQLEQLEEAGLSEGQQEALEQEAETLTHAEEIKAGLYNVSHILDNDEGGMLARMKEAWHTLQHITAMYAPASELAERLQTTYIDLKDMAVEISRHTEQVEHNPERLQEINGLLNQLYSLQQKHHVQTEHELIALVEEYRRRLNAINGLDDRIDELTKHRDTLYVQLEQQANELTTYRTEAAREVERQMVERLLPLGIPNIRFRVDIQHRRQPTEKGMDAVTFLFAANKNGTLQPLSAVASGGEIARVMLAVKAMIAGAVKLPTIVLDEIDTGVSGEIADRMADIMQEMGKRQGRQVISITHLPQIAARGQAHYLVYKQDNDTETNSHIRRLTDEQRVTEIARMLSGSKLTEAALENAKELLHGQ